MKTIQTFINERGNYKHSAELSYGNIKPVDDILSAFSTVIRSILSKSKTPCVVILSSGATNDSKVKSVLQGFIDIANKNKLDIYNAAAPEVFNQIKSVEELTCTGPHISLDMVFDLFDTYADDKEYNYCLLVYDGQNDGIIPNDYIDGVIAFSIQQEDYKTVNILDSDSKNIKCKNEVISYYFPKK